MPALVEELLPVFDVSDEVALVARANPKESWEALVGVDLMALGRRRPLVAVLGGIRMLPEVVVGLLRGRRPPKGPDTMRVREMANLPRSAGGWTLLGEREDEAIALGLVGKFWRPVIAYREVAPNEFSDFCDPGWAKTVYSLSVDPLPDGRSMLRAVTRTACTDERARTWFRRYWALGVGAGARFLATSLLEAARHEAEARATT